MAAALGPVTDVVTEVLATVPGDRSRMLREIVLRSAARRPLPGARTAAEWSAELVANYSAICERRIALCPAVPGSLPALQQLQAGGCRLFVNSATPLDHLTKLLQLRGMEAYFHGVFGAPAGKVENLAAIQRREHVPFARMLMVGDGEDDRLAAREVGCAFAGIVLHERRFQGDADLVLSDLSGLPDFVGGWKTESVLR